MMMKTNYSGVIFGPLRIPFFLSTKILKNPYKEKDVRVYLKNKKFKIPDERVRKFVKENVKKKEEQAKKRSRAFYNGPMARLANYVVEDYIHKLILYE